MYSMHIGHIIRGRQSEFTLLKKCSDGLDVNSILGDNDDDDGKATKHEDDEKYDDDIQDPCIFSSKTANTSDPSQVPRKWLDTEMDCSLTSSHYSKRCNDPVALSEGIRVSENKFCTKYAIHKTPKMWMVGIKFEPEFQSPDVETGFIDGNAVDGHTWRFIKIWKDTCEKVANVVEVCALYICNCFCSMMSYIRLSISYFVLL